VIPSSVIKSTPEAGSLPSRGACCQAADRGFEFRRSRFCPPFPLFLTESSSY
jgi:hypothetical protein